MQHPSNQAAASQSFSARSILCYSPSKAEILNLADQRSRSTYQMESTDSSGGPSPRPNLPPGFRFHPTDEELVVHYLKRKATSVPLPVAIIADVDLYKFDPWELPAKAAFGEEEWYFFSPRERKYPNGARPNRAATSGYWKATGTDKPVLASKGTQKVGVKKALVFYGGKPPKGVKTSWIMHEYRLVDNKPNNRPPDYSFGNKKNSLRLDDWVLCRIYKKNNTSRHVDNDKDDLTDDMFGHTPPSIYKQNTFSTKGSSYGIFPDTNHNNLFEGFMIAGSNTEMINQNNIGFHLASSSSKPQQLPMLSTLKRALPPPYWAEEEQVAAVAESPSKRFHGDCSNISSLLAQTSPLVNQQAMLSDGVFRAPDNLPVLNWFS